MSNYNSTLQSNNTDLQEVLQTLQTKAAGGKDPVLQDKTVTPTTSQQTITADSGYDGLDTVTVNAMPTATQATPSITVDSNGLVTATTTQSAGYVASGTKSATKQLTTQADKTITPSKSNQTAVAKNVYTTGAVTVAAIPSTYITTTDATASADEIMSGETAYVNGSKVIGTFTLDNELTTQDSLIAQIQTALENKAVPSGEDVSAETNAYTSKLATLETAITQLETELQGKASGGSDASEIYTVTVDMTEVFNATLSMRIIYIGPNGYVNTPFDPSSVQQFSVQKGILFLYDQLSSGQLGGVASSDCVHGYDFFLFEIQNDCTIIIEGTETLPDIPWPGV